MAQVKALCGFFVFFVLFVIQDADADFCGTMREIGIEGRGDGGRRPAPL
jgi:hypothetical protein